MGQKVHPTGFRVGIMEDWRSRWYASKHEFSDLLVEDFKIRKFIKKKYGFAGIPKIEIERTRDAVTVLLFTARPGVIIGRKGAEVEKLQEEVLQNLTGRRIEIKIQEVARPEIDAQLISEDIAEQLQKRSSFRRTIKRALEQTMDGGARGVKVLLAGRLGGSEMSRSEGANLGSIPLSTLRARIDYGFSEAKTAQGHIGVKVWVNQGDYLKVEGSPMAMMPKRVKYRKSQKGRVKGNATRGNYVAFGEFGIQSLEPGKISAQTIEAGRMVASSSVKGGGKLYIRIFPHKSVTSIPAETRMGKGKGEVEYWAAVVKPGTVLFELAGVSEEVARATFARVAYKMPVTCRFVTRRPTL